MNCEGQFWTVFATTIFSNKYRTTHGMIKKTTWGTTTSNSGFEPISSFPCHWFGIVLEKNDISVSLLCVSGAFASASAIQWWRTMTNLPSAGRRMKSWTETTGKMNATQSNGWWFSTGCWQRGCFLDPVINAWLQLLRDKSNYSFGKPNMPTRWQRGTSERNVHGVYVLTGFNHRTVSNNMMVAIRGSYAKWGTRVASRRQLLARTVSRLVRYAHALRTCFCKGNQLFLNRHLAHEMQSKPVFFLGFVRQCFEPYFGVFFYSAPAKLPREQTVWSVWISSQED